MIVIIGSPDITSLDLAFLIDLSGTNPIVTATNKSVGDNLPAVDLVVSMFSPAGAKLYEGNFDNADLQGNQTNFVLPVTMPTFQDYLEWSGEPYSFEVKARDSEGKIHIHPKQNVNLCRPVGNQYAGKHFGQSFVSVEVDCNSGEALIRDTTNYSYGGITGELVAHSTTIDAPADQTGQKPAVVVYDKTFNILHKLAYSGRGYSATLNTVRLYDMGQGVTVMIRYTKHQIFDVNCNYDLCPLLSQFGKLLDQAAITCSDDLNDRITRINGLLVKAIVAKMQPTCGYNLGAILDEIIKIGEFDCSCTSVAGLGINGSSTSFGNLNIQFIKGGDIDAVATVNGNNILIDIKDYSYVVQMSNEDQSGSFEYVQNTNSRVKTYILKVNYAKLTEKILTTIGSNQVLLQKFRDLVGYDFRFKVNGKCIIQTNASGDYIFELSNVLLSDGNLQLRDITIDGVNYTRNVLFGGVFSVQAMVDNLNALGKGVFGASHNGLNNVLTISSAGNPYSITKVVIRDSSGNREMSIIKTNIESEQEFEASEIVQAMIDYICALSIARIKVGADKTVCYLKEDGTAGEIVIKATSDLNVLIDLLNSNNCRIISHISNGGAAGGSISCEKLKELFKEQEAKIGINDYLLGTRNGSCGRWTRADVLRELIAEVINTNDSALLTDWCNAVNICSEDSVCSPIAFISAEMLPLQASDFVLTKGTCNNPANSGCLALAFSGFYAQQTLPFDVTVKLLQYDVNNLPTITEFEIDMEQGTNFVQDVMALAGIPALPDGFKWKINGIDYVDVSNKKFLHIEILNNGASSYKVAYRKVGSSAPLSYVTYAAQEGQKTVLAIDAAFAQYDVFGRSVCGPNKESTDITAQTPGCPDAQIFIVTRFAGNFLIQYQFPNVVSKFQLLVDYPGNGGINKAYTVDPSGQLAVPVPSGVFGDFVFKVRSICDEAAQWYGPISKSVIINIPQQNTTCPIVQKVVISDVTATTAKVTVTIPSDGSNVGAFNLILTRPGFAPQSLIKGPLGNPLEWDLTGLVAGTNGYKVQVQTMCNDDSLSALFEGGSFNTPAAGGGSTPFIAFWGWMDDNGTLTEAQIETVSASIESGVFADGANVAADFRSNSDPKFLWVAIPVGQSVKTKWYGSPSNYGNIGAFPNTFSGPTLVSGTTGYNFYISTFKTQQADSTIEFRNA